MEIKLSNGGVALVDDADYCLISKYHWFSKIARSGNPNYTKYAASSVGRVTLRMHRVILGLTNPKVRVDHENGNGLDNRRFNLRVATPSQNGGNRQTNRNNITGFKGVSPWPLSTNFPFRARIRVNGKLYLLGYFSTAVEAAHAYDSAAKKHFGEFARVNFT